MSRADELTALRAAAIPRGVFQTTPCVVDRASGATLVDVDGNEWIDFSGGIGVINVGHTPPTVVEAVKRQAEKLLHGCFHVSIYEGYIRLAEKLNRVTPGSFAKKTMLANSGAEAVENGIKIAKCHTGRPAVICFENAFHGRTLVGMSLTSKIAPYKKGFGPFAPEIYRVPFPYAYRLADGDQARANSIALDCLERAFTSVVDPATVAAVIVEPVLGEGGFVPADAAFFAGLRDLTRPHGILLICDEIQTGFGRTGTLFAAEQLRIDYDLILSAKSLAAGLPLSAVTGRAEVMDSVAVGGIGGTFGGNPVACAAALATIELFETTDLLARARRTGEMTAARFEALGRRFELVGDVRGLGAMNALELVTDRATKQPASAQTKQLAAHCAAQRLSLLSAGTYGNVIRLLAPLNIEEELLDRGLTIIEEGLAAL
jgi:4-aminobutyrate aminotransferase/(S)-3-amino-2-methylpropionate transaminase